VVPLVDTAASTQPVIEQLLIALRKKLVGVHLRGQGCAASFDDFVLSSVESRRGAEIVAKV